MWHVTLVRWSQLLMFGWVGQTIKQLILERVGRVMERHAPVSESGASVFRQVQEGTVVLDEQRVLLSKVEWVSLVVGGCCFKALILVD